MDLWTGLTDIAWMERDCTVRQFLERPRLILVDDRRRMQGSPTKWDLRFNPDTAHICSRHFGPSCFTVGPSGRRRLILGSIPTVNMPSKSIETPKPTERAPSVLQKDVLKLPLPWILLEQKEYTMIALGIVENRTVKKIREPPICGSYGLLLQTCGSEKRLDTFTTQQHCPEGHYRHLGLGLLSGIKELLVRVRFSTNTGLKADLSVFRIPAPWLGKFTKMSCRAHNTCELYFPIPRNGKEKDFIIHFNPDNNEQKTVMRCEIFEDGYKCFKVPGFNWEKLNSTHGLITVSQHVAAESGSFRSQVQGQDEPSSWRCSWSPVDSCSANPTTTSGTDNSTTHARTDTELKEDNNGNQVNIGLIVGIATLVLLAAIFFIIIVLRRFKNSGRNSFWCRFEERVRLLVHKQGRECNEKSAERNPDSEGECPHPDWEEMSSQDDVCLRQRCGTDVTPLDNTFATNQTSACFSRIPTAKPDEFPTSSDCEVHVCVKMIRDDGASSPKDSANEKGIPCRDYKSTSSRNDADLGKPGTSASSLEPLTNTTDGQNRFGDRERLLVQKQGQECSEKSAEKNPDSEEECRYANWEEMSSQGNVWLKERCRTEVIVHENILVTNQTRDDGASGLDDYDNEMRKSPPDDKSKSSSNDAES